MTSRGRTSLILSVLLLLPQLAAAVHEQWAAKGMPFPPAVVDYLTVELNHDTLGCGIMVERGNLPQHLRTFDGRPNQFTVIRITNCLNYREHYGIAWHEAMLSEDESMYTFGRLLKFVTRDGRELYNIFDNEFTGL